jgi:hypothetical protein
MSSFLNKRIFNRRSFETWLLDSQHGGSPSPSVGRPDVHSQCSTESSRSSS